MPGYHSVVFSDHFVAQWHVGMVVICQDEVAWHIATIF